MSLSKIEASDISPFCPVHTAPHFRLGQNPLDSRSVSDNLKKKICAAHRIIESQLSRKDENVSKYIYLHSDKNCLTGQDLAEDHTGGYVYAVQVCNGRWMFGKILSLIEF
jgi:hypothetical protein